MKTLLSCVMLLALCIGAMKADAATFAEAVVSYTPGTAPVTTFNPTGTIFLDDPTAALGKPASAVAGSPPFDTGTVIFPATPAEPLNPFVSQFTGDHLVQIGDGGELVLRLEKFVEVGAGLELGIFGNVGLANNDDSDDASQRQAAANVLDVFQSFGIDDVKIEVSETGEPGSWAALGGGNRVTIQNPASYYTDATGLQGPSEHVADLLPLLDSLTESDFGQPLAGEVTQFNGMTITQIDTALAGSAGGDWFDLDGLMVGGEPLERVGYVRFHDPESTFELMAVSINSSLVGANVVPEPSTLVLTIGMLASLCFTRTIRNSRRATPLRN